MDHETSGQACDEKEAVAMMEKVDGHIILDVRRPDEYASGHIPGAICIPNEMITTEKLPKLSDPEQVIRAYTSLVVLSTGPVRLRMVTV